MPAKKKNSTGCFGTIFGFVLLACIAALVVDLIAEYVPTKIKIIAIIIIAAVVIRLFLIRKNQQYTIEQLSVMEGHRFEYACADILRSCGFSKVKVTPGSGDFGVDVLAEKDGIRYAVQCKQYSNKLDNTSIQEVVAGLPYYKCQKGIVMTTNYFTEPAKVLARANYVDLWDRDVLKNVLFLAAKNKK